MLVSEEPMWVRRVLPLILGFLVAACHHARGSLDFLD